MSTINPTGALDEKAIDGPACAITRDSEFPAAIARAGSAIALFAFARHRGADQIFRNTRVPLVPPKPKLLFTATSIFMSRATFAQ